MNDEETKYEVNIFNDGKWHVKIHANHTEEIKNTVASLKTIMGTAPTVVVAPGATGEHVGASGNSQSKYCTIHGIAMEWGKGKNPPHKPYLFHKDENGKFCFGK